MKAAYSSLVSYGLRDQLNRKQIDWGVMLKILGFNGLFERLKGLALLVAAILLLASCGAPKIYNDGDRFRSAGQIMPATAYNFINWIEGEHEPKIQPDVIIVTLSGGGIRAAALAASTLEQLHKFTINGKPLTDNIVMVSSTSGGSIAAGYIAVHGFGHYDEFRRDFLTRKNTRDLFLSGAGPKIFYDRSSIMQEFLENRFGMQMLTFGQLLQRKDRPFFVFNATDLSGGRQFRFVQSDFNLICTDLQDMPVSVGVAASAAIPFLLTDVEMKNRWDDCPLKKEDVAGALSDSYFDAGQSATQHYRYNLVHAFDADSSLPVRSRPRFLHLADGGLVDNLGVGGTGQHDIDAASSISGKIGGPDEHKSNIRQVLVVEVNARSDKMKTALDSRSGSPGLLSMADLVTSIPIDRTTALTANALQDFFENENPALYVNSGVFVVQIDFDLLSEANADLRNKVKSIDMGLTLSEDQLKNLELASSILLRSSPYFARFVAQSGAVADGYRLREKNGSTGCPFDCPANGDY
jgi:predicted acylesterase/phospholipase RssA